MAVMIQIQLYDVTGKLLYAYMAPQAPGRDEQILVGREVYQTRHYRRWVPGPPVALVTEVEHIRTLTTDEV